MLRIGVIGCGGFASQVIWPCLRYAPVEIGYACSRGLDKAERTRRRFGAERATTDVDAILHDDTITATVVIGPPAMHYEIGLRAIEAGKHVFLDKPPAETRQQAAHLAASAERRGVSCQVGFQRRFATAYQVAKRAATDPAFGGIRVCTIKYSHWRMPSWERHLFEMSVHPLDLVRFFLGDADDGTLVKRTDPEGRSTCVLTLLYPSGATAVLNMSANEPHVQESVELSGANQLITVRDLVDYRRWSDASDVTVTARLNEADVSGWHPGFAIPTEWSDSMHLQGYAGEITSFAESILAGRPVSPSIHDGVAALAMAETILAAPEGVSRWTPRPASDSATGGHQ